MEVWRGFGEICGRGRFEGGRGGGEWEEESGEVVWGEGEKGGGIWGYGLVVFGNYLCLEYGKEMG